MPTLKPASILAPVRLWKNIDDSSGKPGALIRIIESDGTLQGRTEKVFPAPNESQDPKCMKCDGVDKNAPVNGLVIMTGLKKDGDEYVYGQHVAARPVAKLQ